MKNLLSVTAALEATTGLALLVAPSVIVSLLLGASLDNPAELALGRFTGAALLTLGIVCYLIQGEAPGRAARFVISAMLFYNIAASLVLMHAKFGYGLSGLALWPVAVLHLVLAVWCLASLRQPHRA